MVRSTPATDRGASHRNEVLLVGRVAAEPAQTQLPSGDEVVSVRLIVERCPPAPREPPPVRGPRVDTLDCSAWRPAVRRTVLRWGPGDVVEVTGALRRRFRRTESGPVSRWEVEIARARRVSRAPW